MLHRNNLARRRMVWLALWAALAMALLPSLSQALAAGRGGAGLAELCTPLGVRMVAVGDDAQTPSPADLSPAQAHCPFCLPAGHAPALPSASLTVRVATCAATDAPPPRLLAPALALTRRGPPPRGPPTFL